MPTLEVMPRPTPEERSDAPVPVDVDDAFVEAAETIETWVEHRQNWEFTLHEGHDFGRANNVEGRLLFVAGEQTSSFAFRIDQLNGAEDALDVLILRLEEEDGICKLVRCTSTGFDIELFHILTYT